MTSNMKKANYKYENNLKNEDYVMLKIEGYTTLVVLVFIISVNVTRSHLTM